MIVASALKKVFEGLTYSDANIPIKFGYGDQKELNLWIADQNKKINPSKYPLVWYVLNEYTEFQGWITTDVRLVLLHGTQTDKFNEWRNAESYVKVLNPVWKVLENALSYNGNIEIKGSREDRFKQMDYPNYGVETDNPNNQANDFSREASRSKKTITIDVVDAKSINFKMRINVNCII